MQYLVFRIKENLYCFETEKIKEIIKNESKIHSLPQTPNHKKGVVNIRGNVINVLSLHNLLSLSGEDLQRPYIIILENEERNIGIEVDDVLDITESEFLKEEKLTFINSHYVKNALLNKKDNNIYLNLDVDKIIVA